MKRWSLAAAVILLLTVPVFALEREENETAVWETLGIGGERLCLPVAAGYRWVAGGHSDAVGCELLVREGAPLVAMEEGWVEQAETDRGGRLQVSVRSADGRRLYRYSGMAAAAGRQLKRGDWVAGGSVIGIAAGSEDPLGRVQLYLQVRQEGKLPVGIDPQGLLELLRGKSSSVVWLGEERGFCPIGGTGG